MSVAAVETPSGKVRQDENFPVGSFLIRKDLRRHVHAFYTFARQADDIADNPALTPPDKLYRLDRMAAILMGESGNDSPAASALRVSLRETGVTAQHSLDLLRAFKQDAVKQRYASWDELYDYCRYSAMPVGRHVLDLHGESHATWESSDALCASLQILNHLQDCGKDLRQMDRCYIPERDMARTGASIDHLRAYTVSPRLRPVLDDLLDGVGRLNGVAADLPRLTKDVRLKVETGMIVSLAKRLTKHLRRNDPLAMRVKLSKGDFALSLIRNLTWLL